MYEQHFDHIRNDLKAIQEALGGPPYGFADVRFLAVISVASAVFAAGIALGAAAGWPMYLAGLPLGCVLVAYTGYFAVKARGDSDVDVIRRKEYRTSLLVIVPAALGAFAAKEWAYRAGMTQFQFAGALALVFGAALVVLSATNSTHRRFPTAMWYCVGIPLMVCGLVIPACSKTQAWIAVAIMGSVIAGSLSFVYHRDLQRLESERPNGGN